MKKLVLFVFLFATFQAFGQFPNYTNINGRYKWIAGKFDSTFTIPTGTTPSLRTGGGTGAGAMFYRTTDSTIYQYTGTQWIKLRAGVNPSDTAGIWISNVYRKTGTDSVYYVKGGTSTFAFRDSIGNVGGGGGGGKIYYFNGGVSMGTFGGISMYELGDTAVTSAAANFTRSTTGNLANFITDVNRPGLLQIPAGVWTVDAFLSETGGGSNHAQIWVKVEKWNGSTITDIATSPIEQITNGNVIDLYTWAVSIPTTTLAVTDRIIIQFYITNTNGKTVTLYTQNGYVAEIHTTFTTGIGSLNGLTAPTQYFATGTSGTDFAISSSTATHTFNLPTASATNRGALSSADWTTFNGKVGGSGTTNYVSKFTASGTIGNSQIFDNGTNVGIGTASPSSKLHVVTGNVDGLRVESSGSGYLETGKTAGARYRWANDYTGPGMLELQYGASGATPTTNRMTIFSNGNTHINTNADQGYKFFVNGTMSSSGGANFATTSGNVGIITTSPTNLLTLVGATSGRGIDFVSQANFALVTGKINYETTNDLFSIINASSWGNSALIFGTNNTERARFSVNGRFLLGTTTDGGQLLQVNGTIGLPSGSGAIYFNPGANTFAIYKSGTDMYFNGGTGWSTFGGNTIVFTNGANTTEYARINSSGNLGIGTNAPSASSILDLTSTTKGFLPPRMTTTQKNAITSPATGLVVYDTTLNKLSVYTGAGWETVTSL